MKFFKITFLCLIIAILTIGAVSASQDIDNNLTVSDEMAIEDANADVIDNATSDNSSEKEITADDFQVYTKKSLSAQDDEWDCPQIVVTDFPKNGTLQVFVSNKLKFNKNVVAKNDTIVSLDIDNIKRDLGIKTPGKDYPISIKYIMEDKNLTLANYRLYLYDEDSIRISEIVGINDNDLLASITNPAGKYVVGTVKVTVNGKQVYSKKFKSSSKIRFLDITTSDIPKDYAGNSYKVKVTFASSDGKTYSSNRKVQFVNTIPEIAYPNYISVGENQSITLKSAKGSSGNVSVYHAISVTKDNGWDDYTYFKKDYKLLEGDIINGYARIPLSNLTKGKYPLVVEYDVDGYKDSTIFILEVLDNSKSFSVNVTPSQITFGEIVKVKISGPKLSDNAYIYIDNSYEGSVKLNDGNVSYKIYGLKVGKHTIRVEIDTGKKYFSNTFDVVVNKSNISLVLDKVQLKKSSSKLKLTATLKIKGKIAKNKKVTFKFNKKTFSVNTNKKGVAKVTVDKKYYNDLKAGKKVYYQVSYGKVTVRKSVKVVK